MKIYSIGVKGEYLADLYEFLNTLPNKNFHFNETDQYYSSGINWRKETISICVRLSEEESVILKLLFPLEFINPYRINKV